MLALEVCNFTLLLYIPSSSWTGSSSPNHGLSLAGLPCNPVAPSHIVVLIYYCTLSPSGMFAAGLKGMNPMPVALVTPSVTRWRVTPVLVAFDTTQTFCSHAAFIQVSSAAHLFNVLHCILIHISCISPVILMCAVAPWCVGQWIKRSKCHQTEGESCAGGILDNPDLLFPCGLHPCVTSPSSV